MNQYVMPDKRSKKKVCVCVSDLCYDYTIAILKGRFREYVLVKLH